MGMRSVTVGSTPTPVAPFNPRRTSLAVFNNGAADVFLSQDGANITTQGFPLPVDTGLVFERRETVFVEDGQQVIRQAGDEPELALFAQVAAGTENLRIVEQFGSERRQEE